MDAVCVHCDEITAAKRCGASARCTAIMSHGLVHVFVPPSPNAGSRTRPQPAIDHVASRATFCAGGGAGPKKL